MKHIVFLHNSSLPFQYSLCIYINIVFSQYIYTALDVHVFPCSDHDNDDNIDVTRYRESFIEVMDEIED